MAGWVGGWVAGESGIKAISAQPTEVGVGLSWAELGHYLRLSYTICYLSSYKNQFTETIRTRIRGAAISIV